MPHRYASRASRNCSAPSCPLTADRLIITLAAIDGLTNAPVAPAVVVAPIGGANASTSTSRSTDPATGAASRSSSGSAQAGTTDVRITLQDVPASGGSNMKEVAATLEKIILEYFRYDQEHDNLIQNVMAVAASKAR